MVFAKKAKELFQKFLSLEFILIVSLLVYKVWFSFSTFAYSDWKFRFSTSMKDDIFPSFWNEGITLWQYPFNLLYGLFGSLGFNANIAEKFLIFWPIAILGPLAGFLLVKKITNSTISGVVGSLIFAYNTYFLSILTQGHVFLPLGFILGTFAFLSFIYLFETRKKLFIPTTTLFLFIAGSVDFRTIYIISGVIIFYFLYQQIFKKNSWMSFKEDLFLLFSVFIPFMILNLYWIIPNITSGTLTNNEFLNRPIIEGNFYNIQNVSALFYPFWTGREPTWFFSQPIPIYFWLFPIFAFLGLMLGKKNGNIVFFGLLALVGIFLAKQDTQPFGQIYTFLYDYLPGFSAFREASKFYFLIVLSYSVLVGYFSSWLLTNLEKTRFAKYVIIFLIILFSLWNTIPLLTGSIRSLFVPQAVPSDISKINNFLAKQKNFSRVFWINMDSRWVISSDKNPVLSGNAGILKDWEKVSQTFDKSIDLNSSRVEAEKLETFFTSDMGKRLLSQSSYGYVVLNLKNTEFTTTDINTRSWEILAKKLKEIDYLKPVDIGTKEVLIFMNKEVRPIIYTSQEKESLVKNVSYEEVKLRIINTSQYEIVTSNNKPFYLHFANTFHSGWKLYSGSFNWWDALLNQKEIVKDENHFKDTAGLNSFFCEST